MCMNRQRRNRRLKTLLAVLATVVFMYLCLVDFGPVLPADRFDKHRSRSVKYVALGSTYFGSNQWPLVHTELCASAARCKLVDSRSVAYADAVVYHAWDVFYPWVLLQRMLRPARRPQLLVWYNWEPPTRLGRFASIYNGLFHWTASYRTDSDVHIPYGAVAPLVGKAQQEAANSFGSRNFAAGRTKIAFIVTSHCQTRSRRLQYVMELRKHLGDLVDVFGECTGTPCPFGCDPVKLATMYKFYLAFENSRCRDYITEKVWERAITFDIVPIVNGGLPGSNDYLKILPSNSFIHVDDFSSSEALANHLLAVHRNDTKYNDYFKWKTKYKVQRHEEVYWFCRLCDKLLSQTNETTTSDGLIPHHKTPVHHDMNRFWNASADCVDGGIDRSNWHSVLLSYFAYFSGFAI